MLACSQSTKLSLVLCLLAACSGERNSGAPAQTAADTAGSAGSTPSAAPAAGAPSNSAGSGVSSSSAGSSAAARGGASGAGGAGSGAAGKGQASGSGGAAGATAGASSGPAAGSGGATAGSTAAASGAPAPATAGTGASGTPSRGTLPAVDDLEHDGPFKVGTMNNTGPGKNYRLIYPMPLGQDGIKHPLFSWGPGAGSTPDVYVTALAHVASHGFVVLSYNSTPQGKELTDAIDWFVAQNQAADSMLSGKLDTEHIAVGGHSAGSLATFVVAADPRITTTVHMSGGTFDPHTDVKNLRAPAVFLCGKSPMGSDDGLTMGDLADPNCKIDFMNATTPVFYGSLKTGAHVSLIDVSGIGPAADDPTKLKFIGAMIGWLRWKLAGDESLKPMFVGNDCTLCQPNTGWTVQQKNLN